MEEMERLTLKHGLEI